MEDLFERALMVRERAKILKFQQKCGDRLIQIKRKQAGTQ
jgi:hypothetical protein